MGRKSTTPYLEPPHETRNVHHRLPASRAGLGGRHRAHRAVGTGHDCEACPITVRKALEKTPGVKSAKVDLPTKSAVVRYAPPVPAPPTLIKSPPQPALPSPA